jgi:hypothetical protein
MRWLQSIGGECKTGIAIDDAIGVVPKIKLIAPSGKSVVVLNMDQNEAVSPLLIANWDRRLELLSPFRHQSTQ